MNKARPRRWLWAVCLGGLLCAPASWASSALPKPEPRRVQDPATGIELQVIEARSILRLAGGNGLSGSERAAALVRLLAQAWPQGLPPGPWTLLFGAYPEADVRMAEAARCAGDWDARRGRPRTTTAGDWVRRQAADAGLVSELAAALQPQRLSLTAAEQVMLCSPDRVSWDRLPAACPAPRPPAAGQYPCGANLVFQLQPAAQQEPPR